MKTRLIILFAFLSTIGFAQSSGGGFTSFAKVKLTTDPASNPLRGKVLVRDSVTGNIDKILYSDLADLIGPFISTGISEVTGVSGEITVANGTTAPVIGISPTYTTARNTYADGKVAQSITDGVTDSAPSQNQVFDALALKANLNGGNTFTGTQLMPIAGINTTTPMSGVPFNVGNPTSINASVLPIVAIQSMGNNIQGVTMENTSTGTNAEMRFLAKANDPSYLFFTQPGSNSTATTFFGVPKNTGSFIMNTQNGPGGLIRNMYIGTLSSGSLHLGTTNQIGMSMDNARNVSFVNPVVVPPAINTNHAVPLSQLNSAISAIPVPNLQQVLTVGSSGVVPSAILLQDNQNAGTGLYSTIYLEGGATNITGSTSVELGSNTNNIQLNTDGIKLTNNEGKPAFYNADYSANFSDRSIPDVAYVNNQISSFTSIQSMQNENNGSLKAIWDDGAGIIGNMNIGDYNDTAPGTKGLKFESTSGSDTSFLEVSPYFPLVLKKVTAGVTSELRLDGAVASVTSERFEINGKNAITSINGIEANGDGEISLSDITIIPDLTVGLIAPSLNKHYGLTGSGALASLPPITGNVGKTITVANKSTGNIQVYSNNGVATDILKGNTLVAVLNMRKGDVAKFFNDGVSWVIQEDYIDSPTGWQQITDTTYTSGSPLAISSGVTAKIQTGTITTIDTQLPTGVSGFWNNTTDKLVGVNDGDSFAFTLRFKAKMSVANGYADISLNVGGALGTITQKTIMFLKGSGTEQIFSENFVYFTGSTFLANGCDINITPQNGNIQIYDIVLVPVRTHKGK